MLITGLVIIGVSYILSYYGYPSEIGKDIYFIGHALGLLFCAYGVKGNKVVKEAITGFAIGRLVDEIIYFVFDWPESDLTYSLIFVLGVPLLGYCWRNYRKETRKALKWTGIATLAKWLIAALDKLFL